MGLSRGQKLRIQRQRTKARILSRRVRRGLEQGDSNASMMFFIGDPKNLAKSFDRSVERVQNVIRNVANANLPA